MKRVNSLNVPAGGAASVFELEDLVLLEGYFTVSLSGGASPDDAVVLFGDGIAPVAVGCGESADAAHPAELPACFSTLEHHVGIREPRHGRQREKTVG